MFIRDGNIGKIVDLNDEAELSSASSDLDHLGGLVGFVTGHRKDSERDKHKNWARFTQGYDAANYTPALRENTHNVTPLGFSALNARTLSMFAATSALR